MRKIWRNVLFCAMLAALVWTASVLRDRNILGRELIRLHVVADSDHADAQQVKLQVRDAVVESIREGIADARDMEAAKKYLMENLPKIESVANSVLKKAGFSERAVVTLCQEAFAVRKYDTFTLPAGVYESLRIVIGDGEGKNWWCVAFPQLCIPQTEQAFAEDARKAGLPDSLTDSLTGDSEVRFFCLEVLGRLENILFQG